MNAHVEVVYLIGCPHAAVVFEALKGNSIPFGFVIQDRLPKGDPKHGLSSPSVLVNGIQVVGSVASDGALSYTLSSISADTVVRAVRAAVSVNASASSEGKEK